MKRLETSLLISRLGLGHVNKIKIFLSYFYLYFRKKYHALPNLAWSIKFLFDNHEQYILINDVSNYWAIKDIFIDREYDLSDIVDPKIIVDLGSNVGISVIFFAIKYPKARIYALEPNEDIMNDLKGNTIKFPNVHIFDYAVSDISGNTKFFSDTKNNMHSSLYLKQGDSIDVKTISPDDLFKLLDIDNIDLLKFDIEGAEKYLFRNFNNYSKVSNYIGEIHYDLMDVKLSEIKDRMRNYHIEEKIIIPNRRSIIHIKRL